MLGEGTGDRALENFNWEKAQKLSEGQKVRDNPSLLLKAIKKRNKKKEASAKKWGARIRDVQKKMEDKQKRRKQNLEERRKQSFKERRRVKGRR